MEKNFWMRFNKINDSFFLTVMKRGMGMSIPLILVGGIACALRDLPIASYQEMMTNGNLEWLSAMYTVIYKGTFGLISVAMAICISASYAMEKNLEYDEVAMYIVMALGAFGVQLNIGSTTFSIDALGINGTFSAMAVTYLTCAVYSKLRRNKTITMADYTIGMGGICVHAIQAFLPILFIMGAISLLNHILQVFLNVNSINECATVYLSMLFEPISKWNNFVSGLIYVILMHVLWFFGLHGSHIMEPVMQGNFEFTPGGAIFSRGFLDTYVVMGGCGTTICVLIALLVFHRKNRWGKIARIVFPTVIFNVNEMLTFGIPIILNPVLFVPFVLTPVVSYIIAYIATIVGFVPMITEYHNVWTVPVFFSGYQATGSIRGSLVQLVCIIVGVGIYCPFLKWNGIAYENREKEKVKKLVTTLQEKEENSEEPQFLTQGDDMGLSARMLLKDLEYAIRKGDLYLLYQPQISANGECFGAEALVRWNHPMYGFIYPPLIIYLAKAGGILPQLEEYIIEEITRAISLVEADYDGEFKISMNITAKSLFWDIESCIIEKQKKYKIKPKRLWIEITEQEMLSNSEVVIEKLSRLKEAGHTLLIDDFGMGHTSLLYLQLNYFSVVKLDGSLVRNMISNVTNQKIIESVVDLGCNLGVDVIAEYVETQEQQQLLYDLGCKMYQGYMYSKPISLEDFISYIKTYNNAEDKNSVSS